MSVDSKHYRALCDAGIDSDLALHIASFPQERELYDPETLPDFVGSLYKLCHSQLLEINQLRHRVADLEQYVDYLNNRPTP
jgi:hypothetical protein